MGFLFEANGLVKNVRSIPNDPQPPSDYNAGRQSSAPKRPGEQLREPPSSRKKTYSSDNHSQDPPSVGQDDLDSNSQGSLLGHPNHRKLPHPSTGEQRQPQPMNIDRLPVNRPRPPARDPNKDLPSITDLFSGNPHPRVERSRPSRRP